MGRKESSHPTNETSKPEAWLPANQAAGFNTLKTTQEQSSSQYPTDAASGRWHLNGSCLNKPSICPWIVSRVACGKARARQRAAHQVLGGSVSTREILAGNRDLGARHLFQVVNHRSHFADDHPNLQCKTNARAVSLRGKRPQGFAGQGMAAPRKGVVLGGG